MSDAQHEKLRKIKPAPFMLNCCLLNDFQEQILSIP